MIGKLSWTALAAALASAGLGLLLWMGIGIALLQGSGTEMIPLRSMQRAGLLIALVLSLAAVPGLRSAPSAAPATRWRPLAISTLALALASAIALMALLLNARPDAGWVAVAAALLSLGAIGAVLAMGMMASAGRANWRQQLVAPGFLAYALLAGAALLFALIVIKWPGQEMLSTPAASMVMLLVVMGALKLLYWFENGGLRKQIAGARPGQDPLQIRLLVLALLVLIPLLLCAGLILWPSLAPRMGWCAMALAILVGGYSDRQLLASEAGFPIRIGEPPAAVTAPKK
jgi:hypothetical protein